MRILRIITWLIALFALIAMGCVVALYFLINPTSVDKKLQSTLASYGYSIKTNEQPQIRVLPEIFISLPAAKILNEDGESVLHYRQAELTINPLWLAFGKIYIEELKLNGLALLKLLSISKLIKQIYFRGLQLQKLAYQMQI